MNKILVAIVVIAVGIAAGWYFFKGRSVNTSVPAPTTQADVTPAVTAEATPETTAEGKVVVKYGSDGFSPKSITVKKGTTVTFTNSGSSAMWVASDMHPTHQLLPGFDELTSVSTGGTYDYTFVKVGTWTYHNHMDPSVKGTVIVTE